MSTNRADTELGPTGAAPRHDGRVRTLPLAVAILIMIGVTVWPGALAAADGRADHWAAMALFWSMSAGFIAGVGFRPALRLWRWLFSPAACVVGIGLAGLRLLT